MLLRGSESLGRRQFERNVAVHRRHELAAGVSLKRLILADWTPDESRHRLAWSLLNQLLNVLAALREDVLKLVAIDWLLVSSRVLHLRDAIAELRLRLAEKLAVGVHVVERPQHLLCVDALTQSHPVVVEKSASVIEIRVNGLRNAVHLLTDRLLL